MHKFLFAVIFVLQWFSQSISFWSTKNNFCGNLPVQSGHPPYELIEIKLRDIRKPTTYLVSPPYSLHEKAYTSLTFTI